MPKSKLRKDHKRKVENWKQKNTNLTNSFNKKLREALTNKDESSTDDTVKIQTK